MDKYIHRQIEKHCIERINLGLITAIIGARQVGKTTLILKLKDILQQQNAVLKDRIFYYSLDDHIIRSELKKDFRYIEKEVEKNIGQPLKRSTTPILLIVDEAQKSPEIFNWLKIIYDQYPKLIKIIISGSSSLSIKKASRESLAGRITFLKLFPLSLYEIISDYASLESKEESLWNAIPKKDISDFFISRQALFYKYKEDLQNLLERIIIEGTLPGVYTANSIEERYLRLSSMVNTYIEKDIRALGEVGSVDDYSNLLKTLSFEVGYTFSMSSLSSDLGIAYNTVKKYLSILKDTFILVPLQPLFTSIRKRSVKNNKLYFFDVGIANFLAKRTQKEHFYGEILGRIFENILINSFLAENENNIMPKNIYFWRDYEGHEIDFVYEDKDGKLIPVEIFFGKTFPKEKKRNYHRFFNSLHAKKISPYGILLYCGDFAEEEVDNKKIYLVPWWLWW